MAPIERTAREWQARGAAVELLDADGTAQALGSDFYHGGMIDRRAGRLQPLSYARGLARAARAAGLIPDPRGAVPGHMERIIAVLRVLEYLQHRNVLQHTLREQI